MSEREKNARILFVVDDPLLLRVGARLLRDAGYEVIEAATGPDGLRLAQERKPDLVLLGAMLPDLNGVEVCRRIKADPQMTDTYVVMLSATRAESNSQMEALEAGCDGHIARPAPNQELLAHVKAVLRLKHTDQASQKLAYELGKRVKEADDRRFLVEEAKLVQTWAERLSRAAEQLRAEEALEASELRYRRLFEAAQDGILILDADTGQIADVNPFLVEMLGYSAEELRGKRLWEIGLFKDVASSRAAFVELQNKKYIRYADLPLETSDGRRIDVEFVSNVYLVDHQRVIQCNIRDITARRRAEESLQQRTIELEARNEELDAFAHTVAHDLQNLVSLVIGYAELLLLDRTGLSGEELESYLHALVRHGRKMGEIIDGLLLLAGVRKMDMKMEPLDMPSIVAEAQHNLASMIAAYQAEIVVPDTWPAALGYGPWVEQVWVNYISNAIKYGGRPPRVELGAEAQPDGMVRFWVRDNGSGFMPEARAGLFVPFTELAHAHSKGHGLGLSIVQRIVHKLGGQVEAESGGMPGWGSVFSFTLPAVDGQNQDGWSS